MKKLFFLLFLLNCFLDAFSSVPFYRQLQLNSSDPELRVYNVFQDLDGYIWLGTDNGLWKYDGFRFDKVFLDSLADISKITCIAQHPGRELFVGCEDGRIFRKVKTWTHQNTPFKSPVSSILFAHERIWVATYGDGINSFNGVNWEKLKTSDHSVYTMILHSSGKLIAGTDLGLVIADTRTSQIKELDQEAGLPDNIVRSIYLNGDGTVLLGMQEKGVCIFNPANEKFNVLPGVSEWKYGPVNCFAKLANEFWIGTAGKGILDYEFSGERRVRLFDRENGFPFNTINDLLHDRQGNLWVIADNKLLLSPGEKAEFISEAGNYRLKEVNAVAADNKGYVWLSARNRIYRYNSLDNSASEWLTDAKYRNLHITSLAASNYGLWIGTFDNGLYLLDTINGKVRRFNEQEGLLNANVISIAASGDSVWLATLGGIALITIGEDKEPRFTDFTKEGAGRGFVYCVTIDDKGRVWFGTDGNGLLVYENGQFQKIQLPGNRGKVIYSVTNDQFGNIWFSTQQDGICRYDGNSFKFISAEQGLRDNEIAGLSVDIAGNILVVHTKGIDLIDPQRFTIHPIGVDAGIAAIEPSLNAISRDQFGSVWIGTVQGLLRFYNYDKPVLFDPIIRIRRIFSAQNPGSTEKDTFFSYDENQVTIEYAGLWYGNPESVTYQYRLLGYNHHWISTRDRMITFSNLPPGSYTFEVKATRNNNFNFAPADKQTFIVNAPIWKRWWFITLAIISGILITALIIRARTRRLRRMDLLEKERITYKYDTLRSQVNPHFLFNSFNTLIGIIEENQQTAAQFAGKLSDYFRHMVQYRDKEVISLSQELELVNTYYYLQQQRFGEYLSIKITIPPEWMNHFGVPPLSLQLLIENAVKHNAVSFESPLNITLSGSGNSHLVVRNNLNPKTSPDHSTGIGLENITHRFRIVTDQQVEVRKSSTHFEVVLPLIKLAGNERSDS